MLSIRTRLVAGELHLVRCKTLPENVLRLFSYGVEVAPWFPWPAGSSREIAGLLLSHLAAEHRQEVGAGASVCDQTGDRAEQD